MSGLTKKIIYADKTLSALLGVNEGVLVSYAEISKGLHQYIKDKDLKNPKSVQVHPAPLQPSIETVVEQVTVCRDCGEPIPQNAVYCDMCGMMQ